MNKFSLINRNKMLLTTLVGLICASQVLALDVEVVNQWNLLDFNFPFSDYRFAANFKPDRVFFTGFEVAQDRIFLSMPRIYSGVPATLAFIPRNVPAGYGPLLQAYPDWSFHDAGRGINNSCNGLTSVYRMKIDSCNRLWALDSGIMTSLENFRRACPPKIVIFDLQTDQVVRTIIFPELVLRPNSLLTNLVIDESVQGTCDSAFIYMTDTSAPGMVVYDSLRDRAWRVMHPSMYPDPDFSDTTVNGETFTLMDGAVGLAHSPNLGVVYFQPLATNRIFSVPTAALRKGPPAELETLPVSLVGTKSSQGVGLTVDANDDTLIFSPITETSVASWNPINNNQRLIAFDPEKLQFVADMRWEANDGSVWMISTRFQKFFRRTINPQEVNLRILRISPNSKNLDATNNNIYYKK